MNTCARATPFRARRASFSSHLFFRTVARYYFLIHLVLIGSDRASRITYEWRTDARGNICLGLLARFENFPSFLRQFQEKPSSTWLSLACFSRQSRGTLIGSPTYRFWPVTIPCNRIFKFKTRSQYIRTLLTRETLSWMNKHHANRIKRWQPLQGSIYLYDSTYVHKNSIKQIIIIIKKYYTTKILEIFHWSILFL